MPVAICGTAAPPDQSVLVMLNGAYRCAAKSDWMSRPDAATATAPASCRWIERYDHVVPGSEWCFPFCAAW